MSGYVEIKLRTDKDMPSKFLDGLMDEIALALKSAGHVGSVKCTNTKREVQFKPDEKPPKINKPKES